MMLLTPNLSNSQRAVLREQWPLRTISSSITRTMARRTLEGEETTSWTIPNNSSNTRRTQIAHNNPVKVEIQKLQRRRPKGMIVPMRGKGSHLVPTPQDGINGNAYGLKATRNPLWQEKKPPHANSSRWYQWKCLSTLGGQKPTVRGKEATSYQLLKMVSMEMPMNFGELETQEATESLIFSCKEPTLEQTPWKYLLFFSTQITHIVGRKEAFHRTLPLANPTPILQARNSPYRVHQHPVVVEPTKTRDPKSMGSSRRNKNTVHCFGTIETNKAGIDKNHPMFCRLSIERMHP